MSKQLAEQLISLKDRKDRNEIKGLISRHRADVDDSFVSHLREVSNAHKKAQEYEKSIAILRILFEAGQITKNAYISALSLLEAASVQIARRDFDQAMNMIQKCIAECDKSADVRCVELKAEAYHLRGQLQFQQYAEADEGLRSLQTSAQLYTSLKKNDEVDRIQASMEKIRLHVKQGDTSKPLGDVLDEIAQSRDLLHSLQTDIKAQQRELTVIQRQHAQISAEVAELRQTQIALSDQNSALESQIARLQQKLDALRVQSSLLATAQEIPLWVAAVRADLARGELGNLTLQVLEHMRMSEPHYAAPLIAEIRARNALPPHTLFDLSSLSGKARLFAGIANSFALESENPLAAVEAILEAWETFLNITSGSAH